MTHLDLFHRAGWPPLLVLLSLGTSGCTSVLSTASLRDLVWDGGEPHAAEAAEPASDSTGPEASPADVEVETVSSQPEAFDAERREAAIDEAVERLAKLGSIGEAARATLVETLERTEPEDWPTVIDAFAESLPPPETHVAAKADLDATAELPPVTAPQEPEPAAGSPTNSSPADVAVEVAPIVAAATSSASEPGLESPPPAPEPAAEDTPGESGPLTIQNACFATRVQGWGVVDRFAVDRFRPGQEVIVYFELAGLSAGESPAGHTTCIDSRLRLVAADGKTLHDWSFEPIAETCRARRHDYFARYVVRLPETAAAGACRIELGVTDTLSGQTASAVLPLELLQPLAAR